MGEQQGVGRGAPASRGGGGVRDTQRWSTTSLTPANQGPTTLWSTGSAAIRDATCSGAL
ncbi:hypothetical protein [Streptomyces abyssomicinicus]|uniref:hypothetical protein n=1 Tax=Streptomyces abyssomicinicus TaxID=574929 RepID=UPI0013E09D0A|nr:hypothetical protein [Streptomyces abyssomicinicus]